MTSALGLVHANRRDVVQHWIDDAPRSFDAFLVPEEDAIASQSIAQEPRMAPTSS